MKNLSYAFGLASCGASCVWGPKSVIAEGLKQLGSNFSMYRMCTRLGGGPFGVPPELENMINHSWYGGWLDQRIKWSVWLQSLTMLGYYPLENIAWAGYIAPRLFPVNSDKLCQISCIFWVLWILLDLYANHLRLRELDAMEAAITARQRGGDPGDAESLAKAAADDRATLAHKRRSLWLYAARLWFWLPNAVHWSLPPGHPACLPNWLVQVMPHRFSHNYFNSLANATRADRPFITAALRAAAFRAGGGSSGHLYPRHGSGRVTSHPAPLPPPRPSLDLGSLSGLLELDASTGWPGRQGLAAFLAVCSEGRRGRMGPTA